MSAASSWRAAARRPRWRGGRRARRSPASSRSAWLAPAGSSSQMPRNGTGPSSLSITERRLGRCSVQTHVVSMTRPRNAPASRSPRPRGGAGRGDGGARRSGSSASGGGSRARRGTRRPPRPGGAICAVCSKVVIGAQLAPRASGNRYGARGGAGRRNAARTPARRARRGRGRVRHAQGARAAGRARARRPAAAARRARRAAVARARRGARARRAAADAVGAALGGRRRTSSRRRATR